MGWNLASSERRQLREQMRSTSDARAVRRCGALLRLDRGDPVAEVAVDLGVSRQSLYNWKRKFVRQGNGLSDAERSGRPSVWRPRHVRRLQQALDESPREVGFQAVSWTAGLLKAHLQEVLDFDVSTRSIRRKLHDLEYVWKRFRYRLKPDPEREKKKTHPQSHQGFAGSECGIVSG